METETLGISNCREHEKGKRRGLGTKWGCISSHSGHKYLTARDSMRCEAISVACLAWPVSRIVRRSRFAELLSRPLQLVLVFVLVRCLYSVMSVSFVLRLHDFCRVIDFQGSCMVSVSRIYGFGGVVSHAKIERKGKQGCRTRALDASDAPAACMYIPNMYTLHMGTGCTAQRRDLDDVQKKQEDEVEG